MGRTLCSQQFTKLAERIERLESHYLSQSRDISDELDETSEEQQDDIRSCILLSHAEIEYYLEETASTLCEEVNYKIQSKNYNETSMRFIFHAAIKNTELNSPSSIYNASKAYAGYFKKIVHSNNGIKEDNIRHLFSPFIDIDSQVDSDLLADLDSLGAKRGEGAHKGFFGISSVYNASEAQAAIDNVVKGLHDFDRMINQILNE